MPSYGTPVPPGSHGFPSNRCAYRRSYVRVECARCARCVEAQRLDAVKLYGPHAIWRDVGQRLLNDGCPVRTGRHEEEGCWPNWTAKTKQEFT